MSHVPIFIIESGEVSVTFISETKGMPTKVVFTHTETFPLLQRISAERLESNAIGALEKTAKEVAEYVSKNVLKDIGSPVITLAAPWYYAENTLLQSSTKAPVVVKESSVQALIDQEIKRFQSEKNEEGEMVLIDKKITHAVLNGYTTAAPFGKKASQVEFSLFLAFTTKSFKEKVQNAIHPYISKDISEWQSLPLVLYSKLLNEKDGIKEFLILDVGAEISEVSLIRDSKLVHVASIPQGTSSILRHISSSLKVALPIAGSILTQYQQEKIENTVSKKMIDALSKIEIKWQEQFAKAFQEVAGGITLPTRIYFVTKNDTASFISALLTKEGFSQAVLVSTPFEVVTEDKNTFASVYVREEK